MGWRELNAWLRAMSRQKEGRRTSPDSWAGADQDPQWVEMRRKRDAELTSRGGW
jgi:hypothetical protein